MKESSAAEGADGSDGGVGRSERSCRCLRAAARFDSSASSHGVSLMGDRSKVRLRMVTTTDSVLSFVKGIWSSSSAISPPRTANGSEKASKRSWRTLTPLRVSVPRPMSSSFFSTVT